MTTRTRTTAATAAFVLASGAAGTAAAPAHTGTQDTPRITAAGVGQVKLGATHASLRAAGLVGRLQAGCELEGPGVRTARLAAPLEGFVDYGARRPRRVRHIFLRGGAEARGVGVGDRLKAVKRAFPKARAQDIPEFGVKVVRVPRGGGGRMAFTVSARTRRVTEISVPTFRACD